MAGHRTTRRLRGGAGSVPEAEGGVPALRDKGTLTPIPEEPDRATATGPRSAREALRGETVLVTGAAGFIGSHLVEALTRLGAETRAFIRYNSRDDPGMLRWVSPDVAHDIEIVRGDLKDPSAVRDAVMGCSRVFHLGALIGIPYSYVRPMDYVQTNVAGGANLLDACREAEVERVVFASTSEVYGSARYTPIDEDHPLQAQSPYSASKIASDQLALSYQRAFGLPVVLARPFNTFGPRQSTRAVIPTIIAQALSGGPVRLGRLDPTRDFNYVEDTVAAFVRCGVVEGIDGEVFNFGSGTSVSIGDLARNLITQIDARIPIESDMGRERPAASEVERLEADAAKARERLDWTPNVDLDEGLRRTIEFYRAHPDFDEARRYRV